MASAAHRAVERARTEAARERARSIEAEHLLLALVHEPDAARALAAHGLDEGALRAALHAEWEAGLAAAGIERPIPGPPTAGLEANRRPGESFKLALKRGVTVAREHRARRMQGVHLLHGVLKAQHGTVPRALTRAGVNPAEIASELERGF